MSSRGGAEADGAGGDGAPSGAPQPRDVRRGRLLVGAQFVLVGLLVVLPVRSDWRVPGWLVAVAVVAGLAGLAMAALGAKALGPGLTPSPLPNERARLQTGGVFGHVRHPIYTGLLLVGGAIVVVSASVVKIVVLALLVALLNGKSRWEERRLAARFPGYTLYAERTPRFLPRLRRRD